MIQDEYITFTINKQKKIALIAHDSKKQELVDWVETNKDILKNHFPMRYRHHGPHDCR